jgi:Protein of unknown function (DUF3379)
MISHEQYRRALLADPRNDTVDLAEHSAACAECQAFAERLQRFDSRVERALKIDVARTAVVLPFKRDFAVPVRQRWYGLAASVAAAVLVAGIVWLAVPRTSLAADVVAHMAGELAAWDTRQPVPDADLAAVLSNTHMRLTPQAGGVSYASSCSFRGHKVPHLVVQTPKGPVTVMVLVHEPIVRPQEFDEHGYRGTIVPMPGHGSLAVLARGAQMPAAEVDGIAERVRDAIVWTP